MQEKNGALRKYTGKWGVPPYMYNGRERPVMLSGSGYVLSAAAAVCAYEESLKLPFFHLEDVHVNGFAAQSCGTALFDHSGFHHLAYNSHPTKLV